MTILTNPFAVADFTFVASRRRVAPEWHERGGVGPS